MLKYGKMWPNLFEYVQICSNMPKYMPNICPNMLKCMSKYFQICPSIPKCAQVCPNIPTCVQIYPNMSKYAQI